jgi:DNA-binding transcriptional LysR family regulator
VRIVVGHSHPAAKEQDINLERLRELRWIMPPAGSSPRAVIENEFTQHGLDPPRDSIEISDWRIAFDLVDSGDFALAIPFHPACFTEQATRFQVLPIRFTVRSLAVSIVTRPVSAQRPAIKALIETVRRIVAESEAIHGFDGVAQSNQNGATSRPRSGDCH